MNNYFDSQLELKAKMYESHGHTFLEVKKDNESKRVVRSLKKVNRGIDGYSVLDKLFIMFNGAHAYLLTTDGKRLLSYMLPDERQFEPKDIDGYQILTCKAARMMHITIPEDKKNDGFIALSFRCMSENEDRFFFPVEAGNLPPVKKLYNLDPALVYKADAKEYRKVVGIAKKEVRAFQGRSKVVTYLTTKQCYGDNYLEWNTDYGEKNRQPVVFDRIVGSYDKECYSYFNVLFLHDAVSAMLPKWKSVKLYFYGNHKQLLIRSGYMNYIIMPLKDPDDM